MTRIAYLLLCHASPHSVIEQARMLVSGGDMVVLHYDARRSKGDFELIRKALDGNENIAFAPRVRCGWGEWSLVRATLGAARIALDRFPSATHLYCVSGECLPIRPAAAIRASLDADDADIIESVGFFDGGWIRTGLREDRLIYRHFFNERRRKRLFYLSLDLQRRLGLDRPTPRGLDMMIGSQWWCLRRATLQAVVDFIAARPDVPRFFRTTWIPDETFFQTLVRHLVPPEQIRARPPTFLMFSDYGMPVNFHNDHYDLLISQDAFFARKIGPQAAELRARLARRFRDPGGVTPDGPDGRALYRYAAARGRVGRRFGHRAWEPAVPGPERNLYLVVCKKWHIGQALARAMSARTGIPAPGYVFSDASCALPGLGGLEATPERRRRDVQALTGALMTALGTNRLILCIDPADMDTVTRLHGTGAFSSLLEVSLDFDAVYLDGHARRLGLGDGRTPGLCAALAAELREESTRLARARLRRHHRIAPGTAPERNAARIADFLDIEAAPALEIARIPEFLAG